MWEAEIDHVPIPRLHSNQMATWPPSLVLTEHPGCCRLHLRTIPNRFSVCLCSHWAQPQSLGVRSPRNGAAQPVCPGQAWSDRHSGRMFRHTSLGTRRGCQRGRGDKGATRRSPKPFPTSPFLLVPAYTSPARYVPLVSHKAGCPISGL